MAANETAVAHPVAPANAVTITVTVGPMSGQEFHLAEHQTLLVGRAADGVVTVIYTERDGRFRIISAREANDYERRNYHRAAQED